MNILEVENISKKFPGVQALDKVSFSVEGGEIHGLVGENGAGKSTLIKIIMGVYQFDEGEIRINKERVQISNPIISKQLGLNAVYQDIMIADELSIGENFFIGNIPTTKLGLVDWNKINIESTKTLSQLGLNIDPTTKISDLSPGEQTMVTIAKIFRDKARFVIFDEPTSRLTNEESEKLFQLILLLKKEGLGIIYISHHLEEIFEICDRITVLRDGQKVKDAAISEINEDMVISWMVGRDISKMYSIKRGEIGKVMLEVKNLSHESHFRNINFKLHQGEVVGLFGIVGCGRTNVLRAIFGAERITDGRLLIKGKQVSMLEPHKAKKFGIGLIPEDRKTQGLAFPLSVKLNINIASYDKISKLGVISDKLEQNISENFVKKLNIRTPSINQIVSKLSGGNQQKVAIAKWLCRDADILLLDEPTTGVDVGAKVEIYQLIEELTAIGKAVILCSSYMPEVIGLSDRIIVMCEGQISGQVSKDQASEEILLRLASKIPNTSNGEN